MKLYNAFILFLGILLMVGCTSPKKVVYMQDADEYQSLEKSLEYKITINRDDILSIIVTCDDPETAYPYNTPMIGVGREVTSSSQQPPLGYLVDKNGYIDFPTLGKIKVEGLTRQELSEMLKKELSNFLVNPIVTITFVNFKVTVLGEVKNPGSYKFTSERVSILDALGVAGDLQINAKRDNVLVLREVGDEKQFARIDLTATEFMDSPYFYLRQNDVIYVEPNRSRIIGGNASAFLPYVLSGVSTLVAVVALIIRL